MFNFLKRRKKVIIKYDPFKYDNEDLHKIAVELIKFYSKVDLIYLIDKHAKEIKIILI